MPERYEPEFKARAVRLLRDHLADYGRVTAASVASTVSRELRRDAATRSGVVDYRVSVAQWHAGRRARRPKTSKLTANAALQRGARAVRTRPPGRRGRRPERHRRAWTAG